VKTEPKLKIIITNDGWPFFFKKNLVSKGGCFCFWATAPLPAMKAAPVVPLAARPRDACSLEVGGGGGRRQGRERRRWTREWGTSVGKGKKKRKKKKKKRTKRSEGREVAAAGGGGQLDVFLIGASNPPFSFSHTKLHVFPSSEALLDCGTHICCC
jgi:hypothetical protein